LIAVKNVTDDEDLMITNRSGIMIRLHIADLRIIGRAAQGVRLINIKTGDMIAAVTQVPKEEEELEENGENNGINEEVNAETGSDENL
jgi:DNA gyrase subunit A